MSNITRTKIVIFDDFNNVLIAERGKGRNVIKTWGTFGKELKGKETAEKCITKIVDKEIKCTLFDLKPFEEYIFDDGKDKLQVFTGSIKEYIVTHKTINQVRWISKKELLNFNLSEEDIKIFEDFFNRK